MERTTATGQPQSCKGVFDVLAKGLAAVCAECSIEMEKCCVMLEL